MIGVSPRMAMGATGRIAGGVFLAVMAIVLLALIVWVVGETVDHFSSG